VRRIPLLLENRIPLGFSDLYICFTLQDMGPLLVSVSICCLVIDCSIREKGCSKNTVFLPFQGSRHGREATPAGKPYLADGPPSLALVKQAGNKEV
jgi:hypothetical protein